MKLKLSIKLLLSSRQNAAAFKTKVKPLTEKEIQTALSQSEKTQNAGENSQTVNLLGRNPFVETLSINWNSEQAGVDFYKDVETIRYSLGNNEQEVLSRDRMNNFIINELARVSRESDEAFIPEGENYAVKLNQLTNAQSFLNFNLGFLSDKFGAQIKELLQNSWTPTHPDLIGKNYPIMDYKEFQSLKSDEQKLGLVVFAPVTSEKELPAGFRKTSMYVIARGMSTLMQKYQASPESPENLKLMNEIGKFAQAMQQRGFIVYPGSSFGIAPEFIKTIFLN